MKRIVYVSIIVVTLALALFLLLPVVPETVSSCPVGMGCPAPFTYYHASASVAYRIFGLGGLWAAGHYELTYYPGLTCQTLDDGTVTDYSSNASMSTSTTFSRVPVTTCSPNEIVFA